MKWYTHSLRVAGDISINYWRLLALESIELIIFRKTAEEKSELEPINTIKKSNTIKLMNKPNKLKPNAVSKNMIKPVTSLRSK